MRQYAGYAFDWNAFWTYYSSTSKKTDHMKFSRIFQGSVVDAAKSHDMPSGLYSDYVNMVNKKMTTVMKTARTYALSDGMPAASFTHISKSFTAWVKEYYK